MGLSSSQARLLSLTGRMHDIEYKAQKLEAQKLQMANESTQVYKEYENALNKTKVQFKQMAADGSIDYVDATYNILMANNYKLSSSGQLVVSKEDLEYFNGVGGGNAMQFACIKSGFCKVNNAGKVVLTSDESKVCIFNAKQLKEEAKIASSKVLMSDIDVTSSMENLQGTLDGNGHTITSSYNGYIFTSAKGDIKNLNVHFNNAGNGFAKQTSGTTNVENVNLTGDITQTTDTKLAGLFGFNSVSSKTTITNVSSDLDFVVTANNTSVGSLVGVSQQGDLTINNANCKGSINTQNCSIANAGGLAGAMWNAKNNTTKLTIENSYANIAIKVDANSVGGIVGHSSGSAEIVNTYSTGILDVNQSQNNSSNVGGILGQAIPVENNTITIENCYTEYDEIISETASGQNKYKGSIVGAFNSGSAGVLSITNSASSLGGNELGAGNSSMNDTNDIDKSTVLEATANAGANVSTTYDPTTSPNFQHYYDIGKAIESGEYTDIEGYENDSNWLTNMINNAQIILAKLNPSTGKYYEVNIATDTSLQEVTDEVDLKKAEAKYEADMRKINQKDKKFDTDLAAMEAERNAIKTEMETLKSVARDNVDRTYKLFG